jgi:hypothetical protein
MGLEEVNWIWDRGYWLSFEHGNELAVLREISCLADKAIRFLLAPLHGAVEQFPNEVEPVFGM